MAKRSPPASTISAETIASVSGILMVKLVPAPGDRLHVDRAADLLDVGAHHVHADAAAGDVGDLGGGGEARREDELVDLRVRQLVGDSASGDEPLRDRLGPDPRDVEAAAVVGDLDDDVAALVIGREADAASLRLAGGEPLARRLDAVVGASCAPYA